MLLERLYLHLKCQPRLFSSAGFTYLPPSLDTDLLAIDAVKTTLRSALSVPPDLCDVRDQICSMIGEPFRRPSNRRYFTGYGSLATMRHTNAAPQRMLHHNQRERAARISTLRGISRIQELLNLFSLKSTQDPKIFSVTWTTQRWISELTLPTS